MQPQLRNWISTLKTIIQEWPVLAILPALSLFPAPDALAAERVYVSYGVWQVSIPVKSLEVFAASGIVDQYWDGYARHLNPQQLERFRSALQVRANLDKVTVAQFLYTSQGEVALQRLGQVIKTEAQQSGFFALRAAFILAASDPEGLSLLTFLRHFPTFGVRVDLEKSVAIFVELTNIVNRSQKVISRIEELSKEEASLSSNLDFTALPNLTQPGQFSWKMITGEIKDPRRQRTFPFDLYLPLNSPQPVPVVVISHGLASNRNSFEYLAKHLVSYGFAVAVPEHPGSNSQQLEALSMGFANELAQPMEFIDRPLDVKTLLDHLEQLSVNDLNGWSGSLNLQEVGVIGQSFGGYTAFALAGAHINEQQLRTDCYLDNPSWNVSLLLQCRALDVVPAPQNLTDPRVKAIIAVNPVNSSVQGKAELSQISIPVMIIAGTADTIAPALYEQIQPFSWLTTPQKYLILMQGATHFSVISEPQDSLFPTPAPLLGPDPALTHQYFNVLSVAFMKTYITHDSNYQAYLQAAYTNNVMSQASMPLQLLQSLTPEQLESISLKNNPRK